MFESKPITSQRSEKTGLHTPPDDAPPPSYAVNDENAVPDITAAFSNLDLKASGKPAVDQCIAHLKLLEAFHQLREDAATQDGHVGARSGRHIYQLRSSSLLREKKRLIFFVTFVKFFLFLFSCWYGDCVLEARDWKG